jgi:hypothetical protein
MGNRGKRLLPSWVATLGAMHDACITVQAHCRTCQSAFKVDVGNLCLIYGRSYSLIGRTGACRKVGCDGRCLFLFSPNKGTPFRPLRSDSEG